MCYFVVIAAPEDCAAPVELALGGYEANRYCPSPWAGEAVWEVSDRGWCGCNLYTPPPLAREVWERLQERDRRKRSLPRARKRGLKPLAVWSPAQSSLPTGISVPLLLALREIREFGLMVRWGQRPLDGNWTCQSVQLRELVESPEIVLPDIYYEVLGGFRLPDESGFAFNSIA